MTNEAVFQMLKDYVHEARALRLNYFPDLNADIREMDLGIRATFLGAEHYDALRALLRELGHDRILSIQDWMQVRILLFRSDTETGVYSIGPFRTMPFQREDYQQILTLSPEVSDMHFLRSLLNPVPVNISELEALTLARQILSYFHGIAQPIVQNMTLPHASAPFRRELSHHLADENIRRVEETYYHQDQLMAAVAAGDYNRALAEAQTFFARPPVVWSLVNRQQSLRTMMFAANTSCRIAAQRVGIHPVQLDDISQRYIQIFSAAITEEQLIQVYLDMLREYCDICRKEPTRELSPAMQKIVHYILLRLSDPLTLENIAAGVNFSPAYISKKFREELNTTPVAYITDQRVEVAKQLLCEGSMPINEIAHYVGISDWNYFSRVFKRRTGLTPSAYRANHTG